MNRSRRCAVVLALWAGAGSGLAVAGSRLLEKVGTPKVAPYLRLGELSHLNPPILVLPTDLQVRRVGGEKIQLDTDVKYLWAIAADGAVLIAPDDSLPNGPAVGHVNLLVGRPARLAGELQPVKGKKRRWVLNNNSRFGHKQGTTRAELKAARRWFKRIGIETHGTAAELSLEFVPPLTSPGAEASSIARYLHAGGFVLVPDKGRKLNQLPSRNRTLAARVRWAKRVQRIYLPRPR